MERHISRIAVHNSFPYQLKNEKLLEYRVGLSAEQLLGQLSWAATAYFHPPTLPQA
jgi:hypothetical protein